MQMQLTPPVGFCQCGCGQKTAIATVTRRGHRKGDPVNYVPGHNSRVDPTNRVRYPVVDDEKVCADCKQVKPIAEFPLKRERDRTRLSHLCRDCNVKYKRRYHLEKAWGFSHEKWEAIFDAQGRVCAICGTDTPVRGWHVDHDHGCCEGWQHCGNCVRGILCHRCNTGLGMFGDSIERLQLAQRYLEAQRKE